MAVSSLLALIDDIATVLDDISVLTKVAAQKTAGVLGDDLALNAHQVAGVDPERELTVVWAVAKGSLRNKAILVPAALALSAFAPAAVVPLLMAGGAYLCFEGFEKLAHRALRGAGAADDEADDAVHAAELMEALEDPAVDLVALERQKIAGAVRTDFVLSAEIIAITLGTVAGQALPTQALVLIGVALVMTIGVYGVVGAIVKLDDLGLYLTRRTGPLQQRLGAALLRAAPALMKLLAVVGTAAMFLVGGGIVVHGIAAAHAPLEAATHAASTVPVIGPALAWLLPPIVDVLAGIAVGAIVLTVVNAIGRFKKKRASA